MNKVKWIRTFYPNASLVSLAQATGYFIQCDSLAAFGIGTSWSTVPGLLVKEVAARKGGSGRRQKLHFQASVPPGAMPKKSPPLEVRQQLFASLLWAPGWVGNATALPQCRTGSLPLSAVGMAREGGEP